MQKSLNRREFFKDALKASMAMGCLSVGLRKAWAQVEATGKPLLTDKSLNTWLKQNANTWKNYLLEVRSNLGLFLEKYFTLTDGQKNYFKTSYAQDKVKWDEFFKQVEAGPKTKTAGTTVPTVTFAAPETKAMPGGHGAAGSVCIQVGTVSACVNW
jgi:hypothetical protein